MSRQSNIDSGVSEQFVPTLPVGAKHWQAIVERLELSAQQAKIVELALRGFRDDQIAASLDISKTTLRTYLSRISVRTRTRGRMELALRIWAVSREIEEAARRQK